MEQRRMDFHQRKPILLKDQLYVGSSFTIRREDMAGNTPWHFHPEVELCYCLKGKGTHYIGNHTRAMEEGELLLIGRHVPHTRQPDKEYYDQRPEEKPASIVLRFKENFLGNHFFSIEEFMHIKVLLKNARRGLQFYGETRALAGALLCRMEGTSGIPALMNILSLLDKLGRSEQFHFLNEAHFQSEPNDQDSQKINKVIYYTENHFQEPISLSEIAALVNTTEAAFCRYFKTHTGKSYFQYLTELRIAHACRMLMEEDKDIAQVCFSSGFNNPSNFHKQFKKIVHLTPKAYRKKVKKKTPILGL